MFVFKNKILISFESSVRYLVGAWLSRLVAFDLADDLAVEERQLRLVIGDLLVDYPAVKLVARLLEEIPSQWCKIKIYWIWSIRRIELIAILWLFPGIPGCIFHKCTRKLRRLKVEKFIHSFKFTNPNTNPKSLTITLNRRNFLHTFNASGVDEHRWSPQDLVDFNKTLAFVIHRWNNALLGYRKWHLLLVFGQCSATKQL